MSVTICDVSPRDGLQNDPALLPASTRAELVNRLVASGLSYVEVASFVHPKHVPQMTGAEQVAALIERRPGVTYGGLVLNQRGYERLAACELDAVHMSVAATETLNQRNQNASIEQSLIALAEIAGRARADGRRFTAIVAASCGCPFEGAVAPDAVIRIAERACAAGADRVVFADTIGVGVPSQVRELVARGAELGIPIGVHLHDTRGTGLANAYAALEAGAGTFDASVGGVGGCPFAPGATGNIATEDLVYLLHGEGLSTGVDLEALIAVAHWLAEQLDHDVPGRVQRAGDFAAVSGRGSAGTPRPALADTTGRHS